MPHRVAFAALAAALFFAPAAQATEFCPLKKTADGFVALRAGPSTKAKIIARMRFGDEVRLIDETQGGFMKAVWYRGQTRHTKGFDSGVEGWVNPKLVGEECG